MEWCPFTSNILWKDKNWVASLMDQSHSLLMRKPAEIKSSHLDFDSVEPNIGLSLENLQHGERNTSENYKFKQTRSENIFWTLN